MKKITLYDVAGKAGVSPKTVSRVVNNEASVSAKTRELVNSAIGALGYRPNTSARSLRTRKSYLVALLYEMLGPEYVMNLQVGIQTVCDESGYNLLVRPCHFNSPSLVDDVTALLEQSRVDGLILSPPLSDHEGLLRYLDGENKNYVRIAPINTRSRSPFVTANDRVAASELTDYLISLGHRSIGIVTGPPEHAASKKRLSGYQDSLKKAGIPEREDFIQAGAFTFASGEQAAGKLLQLRDAPTAIFASNDQMAAGAMKAAQDLSLSVPEDLALAGFDNAQISKQVWPALTTVGQPVQLIASHSARMLMDRIMGREPSVSQLGIECQLIIRDSTAPPKSGAG